MCVRARVRVCFLRRAHCLVTHADKSGNPKYTHAHISKGAHTLTLSELELEKVSTNLCNLKARLVSKVIQSLFSSSIRTLNGLSNNISTPLFPSPLLVVHFINTRMKIVRFFFPHEMLCLRWARPMGRASRSSGPFALQVFALQFCSNHLAMRLMIYLKVMSPCDSKRWSLLLRGVHAIAHTSHLSQIRTLQHTALRFSNQLCTSGRKKTVVLRDERHLQVRFRTIF